MPAIIHHAFGDHTFFALIAGILLILFALAARRALAKAQDPAVPAAELGSQNIAELVIQLIVSQSDQIIGPGGRKYVPFFGTFFFFILLSNLLGLVPGFAPPTGNLNTTVGLALCSFIGYNIIGIREQGMAYFKHFIGPMTSLPGQSFVAKLAFAPLMLVSICFFLILELFSHGFRPVSLSLRLFGNMDDASAVQRQCIDDASLHKIDNKRTQADLDRMGTHTQQDRFSLAMTVGNFCRNRFQILRRENIRQTADKRPQGYTLGDFFA